MIVKSEIKRFIYNPILLILLLISILWKLNGVYSSFEPYINTSISIQNSDINTQEKIEIESDLTNELNSYNAWLRTFVYYMSIVILISCLPFSTKYITDKKSGYLKNILLRCKKSNYLLSKVVLNALSGGIIVSFSSIITLIILSTLFTNEIPSIKAGLFLNESAVFIDYLFKNPTIYVCFVFIIMFFIGITYSTFSLAIGMITENIILSILIPQVYWLVGGSIMDTLGIDKLNPWNIMYFNYNPTSFKLSIIHTLCILIISLLCIYIKSKEEIV